MNESSSKYRVQRSKVKEEIQEDEQNDFLILCGSIALLGLLLMLVMVVQDRESEQEEPARQMDVNDPMISKGSKTTERWSMKLELFSMFLTAIFAMFLKATTGFGDGITYQIGYWTLASLKIIRNPTLLQSVMVSVVGFVPVTWFNSCWLASRADVGFTSTLWAAKTTGAFIGSYILVTYENDWVTRCLGLVLIVCLAVNLLKDFCYDPDRVPTETNSGFIHESEVEGESFYGDSDSEEELLLPYRQDDDDIIVTNVRAVPKPILFFFAFFAGIFAGLFGVGGAPMMLFGLFYNLDGKAYAAAVNIADGFGNGIVSLVYAGLMSHGLVLGDFPLYLALIGGSMVGFGLGRLSSVKINQRLFVYLLRFVLFSACLLLLTLHFGILSRIVSVALGIAIVAAVVGVVGYLAMTACLSKSEYEIITFSP